MTKDPRNLAMGMAAAALGTEGLLVEDLPEATPMKDEDLEPSREHIKRGFSMSHAMRELGAKKEQERRLINKHRVACNDLEGIPPVDVALITAAEAKRARRALKRK